MKMDAGTPASRSRGGRAQKNKEKVNDHNRDDEIDFPPWSVKDAEPDLRCPVDDYRDFKDSGLESSRDVDDPSPSGKSRIPVSVRRLRERSVGKNGSEESFRSAACGYSPRYDLASLANDWTNYNFADSEASCKVGPARRCSRSENGLVPKFEPKPKSKVNPQVCPHCNRNYFVISKEGVYVAFSIGRRSLMFFLLLAILTALAPYVYPEAQKFIRNFKVKEVPATGPPKPRKGWFS